MNPKPRTPTKRTPPMLKPTQGDSVQIKESKATWYVEAVSETRVYLSRMVGGYNPQRTNAALTRITKVIAKETGAK